MKYSNFISFSGGKDSTAMLLMMLERGEPVDDIIFFDTGWEFPEMYAHLERVEQFTGRKITRLQSKKGFIHWLLKARIFYRQGPNKGQYRRRGNGWPSPFRRWCTREKIRAIDHYTKGQSYRQDTGHIYSCIGIALDECHRAESAEQISRRIKGHLFDYPLMEFGVTEAEALQYCKERGFDWGGLYDIFDRVSCFCCPLQSLDNLRKLRSFRPELWSKMLQWENEMDQTQLIRFHHEASVHDLDNRFEREAAQRQRRNAA